MPSGPNAAKRGFLLVQNTANRHHLRELLEGEGVSVIEASTLEDAQAQLSAKEPLAVFLIDLGGFTPEVWPVCERVADAGVPVVVLTDERTADIEAASLRVGAHSVLEKPIRKANLRALIASLVEDPVPGDGA